MIIREERIGGQRLILGDCLAVMPALGMFDAVVTDPPYGVLSEDWDAMDAQELAAFTMQWVGATRRMSDRAVVFFGQKTRQVIQDILYAVHSDIRQIIWSKGGGTVASDGMFYSYESAYLCRPTQEPEILVGPRVMDFADELRKCREGAGVSKGQVDIAVRGKKTGLCYRWEEACCLPSNDQVALIANVMTLTADFHRLLLRATEEKNANVTANIERTKASAAKHLDVLRYPPPSGIAHPTSKPIGLMHDLCEIIGGQTILDPFMGSGTTLVACQRLGRSGTGIELDPDYFDIACKRVDEAARQPDMFVAPPDPQPKQEPML